MSRPHGPLLTNSCACIIQPDGIVTSQFAHKHEPFSDSMAEKNARDFIRAIIDNDLRAGRCSKIITRFPPEPNGFPHIGHAKSVTLNFGLALEYGGTCYLRFDDTNPTTEDVQYVEAIKSALTWLGYSWGEKEFYASDYFEQLYKWACRLVRKGLAYVDDLPEEEIRAYRGTVTELGRKSPYRERSVAENLELFARMRAGEFGDGTRVLRAKIDMEHHNMKMRDPLMYRIRHAHHYRQENAWCIYPFYDWAHGQSDAIEGITHSICTLEFTPNRVLYDWYLDALGISPRPFQYEFARLNLGYAITSKRKLLRLVTEGHVDGWDDPRMPTLAGVERRGITPAAIRSFCNAVGTTKVDSISDPGLLDHHVRDDLNRQAPRVMCVLDPLRVTLTNYPPDNRETLHAPYWPHDIGREGTRPVPFSASLFVDRSDFSENPKKGFRRLSPGAYVRLRYAYVIRCDGVIRDEAGGVVEVLCTWFQESRSGGDGQGPKARGTIHWVDASASLPAEVRLYERLFSVEVPGEDFITQLNPTSKLVMRNSRVEPSVLDDPAGVRYQFTRLGYFWRDPGHPSNGPLVFNRIASLRDSWTKLKAVPTPMPRSPAERVVIQDAGSSALSEEDQAWLAQHGLSESIGRALLRAPGARGFFEDALGAASAQPLASWVVNQLLPAAKGKKLTSLPFEARAFGRLVTLVAANQASSHQAREVLAEMVLAGGDPDILLEAKQASTLDNEFTLRTIIDELLSRYPDKVSLYRKGKTGLLGFFVGQVVKATGGAAPPKLVRALLQEQLDQHTA